MSVAMSVLGWHPLLSQEIGDGGADGFGLNEEAIVAGVGVDNHCVTVWG